MHNWCFSENVEQQDDDECGIDSQHNKTSIFICITCELIGLYDTWNKLLRGILL